MPPPFSIILTFSPCTTPPAMPFIQFQLNSPREFARRTILATASLSVNPSVKNNHHSAILDSLRVLQWDQLCDCVASFAGTSLGNQAAKEQLWNLDKSYEDSIRLLEETNAAVEMQNYGAMMDFSGVDVALVKSGMRCALREFPVSGSEAMALVNLLQFAETLQSNVKSAIREDSDWLKRFMPLSEMILELEISRSLIKLVAELVDEDGSVRDSASSDLRQARERVRSLERKLYQLMENMIRYEMKETSNLEVSNVDGRWCIKSGSDMRSTFDGLLLSSGAGAGNLIEPLSAVPLNDELQQARASVARAEAVVLLKITKQMQEDLIDIEYLFNTVIQIDAINARARYSISFGGAWPDLYLPQGFDSSINANEMEEDEISIISQVTQRRWALYLPKAHHPLLLQQHRHNLRMAMKDLSDAKSEIRRRKQLGGTSKGKEEPNLDLPLLEMQVAKLKQDLPTPFDILIDQKTKVLIVTGPNTGGKTIFLKTVGLAAMMAKSGLYVLASEPARIPWFDFVLADIGDEQSLSQSLSTFSGHLKQISDIKSLSTSLSLVLLDEVGAGTNPLEGAALGMSLLEFFAKAGSFLTMATTHHGELKTLKYSNDSFENACMEFDEVNLKPTYRILWGVPGRSNAINIAERLGLPAEVVGNARELYGAASNEINEVIVDMEKFKQEYHENVHQSQHYLRLSKNLHQRLLVARNRVTEHGVEQRHKMVQEISDAADSARSIVQKKVKQFRSIPHKTRQQVKTFKDTNVSSSDYKPARVEETAQQVKPTTVKENTSSSVNSTKSTKQSITRKTPRFPKVGDTVNIRSLNSKATVVKLDTSTEEIVVQSGFMKLKVKLADIGS